MSDNPSETEALRREMAAMRAEQAKGNRFARRLAIVLGALLALVLVIAMLVSQANRANCDASRTAADIARYC